MSVIFYTWAVMFLLNGLVNIKEREGNFGYIYLIASLTLFMGVTDKLLKLI